MADGTKIVEPVDSNNSQLTTVDSHEVDFGSGDVRDRQRVMLAGAGAADDVATAAAPPSGSARGLVVRTAGPVMSSISDENGVPYTSSHRLPVDIAGANITGSFTNVPSIVSTGNVPPGPLGANATFTGAWEDVLPYAAIVLSMLTDAPSATNGAILDFSADGATVLRSVATTITANVGVYFHLAPEARYFRVRYINGATAQTLLRVSVLYSYQTPAEVVQPIGATITDLNAATVVRAALAARIFSGGSAGAYAPLGTDGAGNLQVKPADIRTLTERMFARAPQSGYSLWIDTSDLTYIYLAEAPSADAGTATTFQGIRVTKDATGNPLGKVQVATAFAWNSRGAATWI